MVNDFAPILDLYRLRGVFLCLRDSNEVAIPDPILRVRLGHLGRNTTHSLDYHLAPLLESIISRVFSIQPWMLREQVLLDPNMLALFVI
jgi:hypothetical protein